MNWYKKAQKKEIYRGDPEPLSIENYDPEYGIKEMGKTMGGSRAWGPGIYFADKKDIAEMYGSNITEKTIQNANILTPQSPLLTSQQIKEILNDVDKEILRIASSNWDEDYNIGMNMLINLILSADNPLEQLINIWAEIFHRQNPNYFINLMAENGIDGISLQKEDVTYYVIYNKNVLK